MPWRRSLGHALGRVSIFLVQKIETGASQNESHHHFKTNIIFIIYHFEKISIPFKKRMYFEMTLEIIIIILSKRKSYLVVILKVSIMGQAQRILGCAQASQLKRTQYHIPIQWIGPPLNSGTARIFITD